MGGCASKPKVLKSEADAPAPAPAPIEEASMVTEPTAIEGEEVTGGEAAEAVEGEQVEDIRRRSLGILFKVNEETGEPSETSETTEKEGQAEQLKTEEHPVEQSEPKATVTEEKSVDSSSKAEEVQTVKGEASESGVTVVKEELAATEKKEDVPASS